MIFSWHGRLVCGWAANHGQDSRATMCLGGSVWVKVEGVRGIESRCGERRSRGEWTAPCRLAAGGPGLERELPRAELGLGVPRF